VKIKEKASRCSILWLSPPVELIPGAFVFRRRGITCLSGYDGGVFLPAQCFDCLLAEEVLLDLTTGGCRILTNEENEGRNLETGNPACTKRLDLLLGRRFIYL